jgi:hypothetical protein
MNAHRRKSASLSLASRTGVGTRRIAPDLENASLTEHSKTNDVQQASRLAMLVFKPGIGEKKDACSKAALPAKGLLHIKAKK